MLFRSLACIQTPTFLENKLRAAVHRAKDPDLDVELMSRWYLRCINIVLIELSCRFNTSKIRLSEQDCKAL